MENKQLLLKDLCARLPYDLYVEYEGQKYLVESINRYAEIQLEGCNFTVPIYEVKPYLRPMLSMTDEEYDLLYIDSTVKIDSVAILDALENDMDALDWLYAHHFDFRDLIKKGLAIAVTKDNNPCKE